MPICTAKDLESEIKILTNLIRTSVIKSRIPEDIGTKKMQWWSKKLYGLRNNLRKAQNTFQNRPNTENCRLVRELKTDYQIEIRRSK